MGKVLRTAGAVAGIVGGAALILSTAGVGGAALATVAKIAGAVSPPSSIAAKVEAKPMTAISLFTDHRRSYLITDGAYFDTTTGRILTVWPKTLMFAKVNMAIAISGWGTPERLCEAMGRVVHSPVQSVFLQSLPQALMGMRLDQTLQNATPLSATRLWIATYDRSTARPRAYLVESPGMPDGFPCKPFTLTEVPGYIAPLTPDMRQEIMPAGYVNDPVRDGRRLIQAQRQHVFPSIGDRCAVGGECGLYTVDRRGVTYRPLIRYPETAGEFADPATPGVLA